MPHVRSEPTSVVKRMLGSGTYSAVTRGNWRFLELQRHFIRQWSYQLNQICSKNNSRLMNQLTSSHDSGVLMRPVSPSCPTVCTLVPPENMNCRYNSDVSWNFYKKYFFLLWDCNIIIHFSLPFPPSNPSYTPFLALSNSCPPFSFIVVTCIYVQVHMCVYYIINITLLKIFLKLCVVLGIKFRAF